MWTLRMGWEEGNGAISYGNTNGDDVEEVWASGRLAVRLRRSRASVRGGRVRVEGERFWRSMGRATEVVEGIVGFGGTGTVEEGEVVVMAARG
jgi:hypothetical protein